MAFGAVLASLPLLDSAADAAAAGEDALFAAWLAGVLLAGELFAICEDTGCSAGFVCVDWLAGTGVTLACA